MSDHIIEENIDPEIQDNQLNKDQIFAHFHEITHIEDFEQCQAILESTNWNLDQALQSFFNGDVIIYIFLLKI